MSTWTEAEIEAAYQRAGAILAKAWDRIERERLAEEARKVAPREHSHEAGPEEVTG